MAESRKVFVGLPAYNEEAVLEHLLRDLNRTLSGHGVDHEIIVVDDGSTDGTREILERCSGDLPLHAVHHSVNQNLGGAMRTLLRTALERGSDPDVLVCMDADNTFRPEQIENLLQCLTEGASLAVASRYTAGGGTTGVAWYRNLMSWVANRLFRALFPIPGVTEYTCSFRAYRLSLLREMERRYGDPWITEDGFTSMPEIIIRLSRLPLQAAEIPAQIRYDLKVGGSKMKVLANVLRTLGLMRRLRAEFRRDARAARVPATPS